MSDPRPPAEAYARFVDVDPPLAEHVLQLLAGASIPAYAEPLVGDTGPYRDVRAPDRPTTRIYVAISRLPEARTLMAGVVQSMRAEFHADAAARTDAQDMQQASADRIAAAWDDLVAGFHTAEPPPRPGATGSGLSQRLVREHSEPEPGEPVAAGPRDYALPDELDDEGFTPPPPPPIPRPRDRFSAFAWAGAIGGPIAMILSVILGVGGWLATAGFFAFAAGFITLVARGSDRRDGGDGAVV
jgi:hypothetical protein